jgi:AraC-like DNA-binding protein
MARWRPHDEPATTRTRLLESQVALVEDLRSAGARRSRPEEAWSPRFQVCLPYKGLFIWHVNGDDVVGDPNQVLFVREGESFRLSQPACHEYAEMIVTPDAALLADIAGVAEARLADHDLFRQRSCHADLRLQRFRSWWLHRALTGSLDGMAGEESIICLLRAAFERRRVAEAASPRTRRLIRLTKEYLQAHLSSRVRLGDVAAAVGASAAYLTDVFHRSEGVPIHRYLVQLRLARALVELPHANDLTMLALELGFSSHSHFTAAFRRAFGSTPSVFRESTRTADRRLRAS